MPRRHAVAPSHGFGWQLRSAVVLTLTALLAAGLAPHALAAASSPSTGPSTVGPLVLHGAGGSVTVDRDPFRLLVRDPAGRMVLAETPNSRPAPAPYASPAPAPLGSTTGQAPPQYAPLSFLVGTSAQPTYPATPWEGNLLVGAAAGVQYSARSVLAAQSTANTLRLLVSTNDPTGRTLTVTITAAAQHFVVDAQLSAGPGALLGDAFASTAGEAFHGFGGRHDGINHAGQSFDTWVEEENFGAGPAQPVADGAPGTGGPSYLFPNGPAAAYYVQPQFISNHGYGFLLDQSDLARWRMDSDRSDAWTVQAAAGHLRYVVAPGNAPAAIRDLTALTGRHPVPPAWAQGPQLDRLIYANDTPAGYLAKVQSDLAAIRRTHLPLTAYRIEGWPQIPLPTLRGLIAQFHALGIHVLLYYRAYAAEDLGGTDYPTTFPDALQHGYFTTTAAGTPYVFGSPFGAGVAGLVDFTNPAAVRWFAQRVDAGLDLGADGFMADFGEQTQPDMHFANGQTGATMHNAYPVLYARVVRDILTAYETRHPGRTLFTYNRAGYSGSARYESANFPGDETTDWSVSSGLASQTPDMLNRAVGGAYGFTTDIGGYEDATTGPTSKELFLRWAEWAALSPLFRDHGSANAGTHTPYSYDAQTLRIYTALSKLHTAAAPLIRQLWTAATRTGMPITRPLWLAYPGDPHAAEQQQEWLLGPDVLVAPVVTQSATRQSAYLPAGCWRYVPTGTQYSGGHTVTVPAALATLPYFFRCGTTPFTPPSGP